MNRHGRRAARAGKVLGVDFGRLEGSGKIRPLVNCYVCGTMHAASAVAIIRDNDQQSVFGLCEPCFANRQDNVTRKFLHRPDIRFIEGGEITDEHFIALREKQNASEH